MHILHHKENINHVSIGTFLIYTQHCGFVSFQSESYSKYLNEWQDGEA